MVSLRYHIVSIASVFLALALGIFLGATKSLGPFLADANDARAQITAERDELKKSNEQFTTQLASSTKFAEEIGPLAVRGTLPNQTVVLITTPETDPSDRDAVVSLLNRSGAKVTAQFQLSKDFTDPSRAEGLRSLIAKSLPAGVKIPEVASVGTVAGTLLASVLLVDKDGKAQAKTEEATAAMTALNTGGYVITNTALTPGRLVVVLTGGALTGGAEGDRAKVVADMAAAMRPGSGGVMVAGRTGSATDTGTVGLIRDDATQAGLVTTVDNLDTGTGRLATILGLVEQSGGGVGRYGSGEGAVALIPNLAVS